MRNRPAVFVGVSFFVCCWMAVQFTAPLSAQQKDGTGESGERTKEVAKSDLDVRYAKAYLALLQATLDRYEEMNRNAPNTIRPTVIQAIQEGVRDARERVQQMESVETNESAIYVTHAEAELRVSEEVLKRSEAAVARRAGSIGSKEIERLKAKRELDKINVEKARHLASESPLSNLRYELGQLREDVQELRLQVAILQSKN
jgi:TolA-binding protein